MIQSKKYIPPLLLYSIGCTIVKELLNLVDSKRGELGYTYSREES